MADAPPTQARDQSIRSLYERHADRLFRTALRIGGGRRSFAEDVVQDVFVSLIDRYDRLDGSEDLGGWLYRCAMNACFSRLRKEAVRRSPVVIFFTGALYEHGPDADIAARLDADKRLALDALAKLPPKERMAFCMIHVDEAPLAEVATVLGCSVSYACKLSQKAEERLVKEGYRSRSPKHRDPLADVTVHTPAFGVRYG